MTVGRIPSVEGGIQPTLLTTKGDIIVATGNATLVRQGVGADGTVLTANSAQADGVEWGGAWTTFTPTWTNVTVGNATNAGRYCQIGKVVFVKITFGFGSTTSFTGPISFANPIAGTGFIGGYQSGVRILDAGTQFYQGFAAVNVSNTEILIANVAGTYPTLAQVNATVPFTWAATDEIQVSYWYEVA